MTGNQNDVAEIIVPPALLLFGCLAVGAVLHWSYPVVAVPSLGYSRTVLCSVLFAVFVFTVAWGLKTLERHGTPVDTSRPTQRVVEAGPYRMSRNPLYLALVFLFASFTVLMNSVWMVALLPVLWCLLHFGVVLPEEEYLQRRFGEPYLQYCQRVPRWL